MAKKAYCRMQLLSKLRYIGVRIEDLLDTYCLFIRSILEYSSVAFHSSLNDRQTRKLESIQVTALKICLRENFVSANAAREMTGISLLSDRRELRCSKFARQCILHPQHKDLFPLNPVHTYKTRTSEKYHVNHARTEFYKNSAVIYCQNLLNKLSREGKA